MKIPASLEALLLREGDMGGPVIGVWNTIGKALKTCPQELYFFPEYTDHGERHIEGVLATANELIAPESFRLLSPQDAAVLILSVLLHDCAMHLGPDLFLQLVKSSNRRICPTLDALPWSDQFEAYLNEASHWDGRKLNQILGDRTTADVEDDDWSTIVRQHPLQVSPEKWTVQYRKFLGEFIRRNHARLAHEFAVDGHSTAVDLSALDPKLRDIAGFVARSHNLAIRATFDYLKREHGGRAICRQTRPVYLMGVLRIADYLQIDSSRISQGLFGVRKIRCPLSHNEWATHIAVSDIRPDESDAESLFIFAEPSDAHTFLKLRQLLAGIQSELDTTWAAFGEVFSQNPRANGLAITLRRVRSNLDFVADFVREKSPTFYPIEASFRTADAALLKLLIRPLYGSKPEVGVRELLQNSLDAIRELDAYRKHHPPTANAQQREQVRISIAIERTGEEDWFTITDRGIGMTAETVRDYFLTAGASFRNSEEWWRDFGLDGHSTVLRSGRFGVGALSAFLLGPRIQVWTRHARCAPNDGVYFDTSIGQEHVELSRQLLADIGTTIRIKLTDTAAQKLRQNEPWWDWYILTDEKMDITVDGLVRIPTFQVPSWHSVKPTSDWVLTKSPGLEQIQWANPKMKINHLGYLERERAILACNGIRIGELTSGYAGASIQSPELLFPGEFLGAPHTLIFDPDGNLPLTLQRDRLAENVHPFMAHLAVSMSLDFIAFLLVYGPTSFSEIAAFFDLSPISINMYPLWQDHIGSCLFCYKDGFGVATPALLGSLKADRIFQFNIRRRKQFLLTNYLEAFPQLFSPSNTSIYGGVEELMWIKRPFRDKIKWQAEKAALLIPDKKALNYLDRLSSQAADSAIPSEPLVPRGVIYFSKSMTPSASQLKSLYKELTRRNEQNIATVAELFLDLPKTTTVSHTIFDQVWNRVCPQPVIPFSMTDRREIFAATFTELAPFIAKWAKPEPEGWRIQVLEHLIYLKKYSRRGES